MTKAEKMAEEWVRECAKKPGQMGMWDLRVLIHQVAERTREECAKTLDETWDIDLEGDYGACDKAIRSCRWEDDEYTPD